MGRIEDLPRRDWRETADVETWTNRLKTPAGSQRLRPIQAAALAEAAACDGLFLHGRVGCGKALAHGEPVLTPHGWEPIESIRVGDRVVGSDGRPTNVIGVFPQGVRETLEMEFSDGSHVECDADHLWTFRDGHGKLKTKTAKEWSLEALDRKCGEHRARRFFLPMLAAPAEFDRVGPLPIDPYTLGALLGDGSMSQGIVSLTTMDPDILGAFVLPESVTPKKTKSQSAGLATSYNLTSPRGKPNPLLKELRRLNLQGKTSHGKFIPPIYLRACARDRLALLQGLLDTDGHHCSPGAAEYSSMSEALAGGVCELAELLGGTAVRSIGHMGQHRVRVKLPKGLIPFRCERKRIAYLESLPRVQREPFRAVVAIRKKGRAPCTCIAVDAQDKLFVIRNGVLTHNTLIAGLLAEAMGAKRPLLLVRASDVKDTEEIHRQLRAHWKIPRTLRIRSYNFLSHRTRDDWLFRHPPDLIIADEGHKLKDTDKSATAIRVIRYLREMPMVRFCVMSGTLTPHGDLKDYAHLLVAALRNRAPIPLEPRGLGRWRKAMEGTGDPSVLFGAQTSDEAMRRFKDRLASTPGVIISADTFDDVPVHITSKTHDSPEGLREPFQNLRDFWEAPDKWSYGDDSFQVAATARQFANGFYYRHDPRPPDWFLEARKRWTNHCRLLIESEAADSEGQVSLQIDSYANWLDDPTGPKRPPPLDFEEGRDALVAWREASAAFPLRTVADWLAAEPVAYARDWARPRGIIWVAHIEFGEMLEQVTGLKFFHGQKDRNILHEDGSRCIIASIQANGTSKNLQAFCHNLIMAPPANGEAIEQLIGRTHREGQTRPVTVEFYVACREHWNAVAKSIDAAEKISYTLSPQKMANVCYPPHSEQDHPAWQRARKAE